jgi:PLP dependent protein
MLIAPQNLSENLRRLRERIAEAAKQAQRATQSITLLAVSKTQPVDLLRSAVELGLSDFGENYLNEALSKITALNSAALTWHFIGHLQSNKTRAVAEYFQWVHGIDRFAIAERLSMQRPGNLPPLNVCIQINLAAESGKSGVSPTQLAPLAQSILDLPRLHLRGLMCLPPAETDPERQRHWFAQLRSLQTDLQTRGISLDTLSMGMSADLEAAVLEGASILRVGTALFGARK